MRHNQNRRSRGRNRKGPNPLTRSFESNGPDVKVRGTAAHIADKYLTLARDAHSSGDIVAAENYLQHAEHYSRIVMAAQTQFQQDRQQQYREGGGPVPDEGYDDDRQMNGRGRDRFDYNGPDTERSDDDGEEQRAEAPREGDNNDRGYRPRRPNDRQDYYDQRRDRPDRERPDFSDRDRPQQQFERPERQDANAPQPVVTEAAPPPAPQAEEQAAPAPRRRRGRPPRNDNGAEPAAAEADTTPDGAAALVAFPD